jgi:hypothetical protein
MSNKPGRPSARQIAETTKQIQAATEMNRVQSRVDIWHHGIDSASQIIHAILKTVTFIAIFYYLYQAVVHLAGKETSADLSVDVKMLASRHTATIVGWIFGIFGCSYGLVQRRLYRKTSAHLKRIGTLEEKIDRNRSSSGLKDGWKSNDDDI